MKKPGTELEVLIAAQDIGNEEQLPLVARQIRSQGVRGLLINQTSSKNPVEYLSGDLRILSFAESGISKSRNRALSHAKGDILLFTDDDVELLDGFSKRIGGAFEKYPEADLITFQCLNEKGDLRKNYSDKSFWHTIRTVMRVSSVEIAVRRSSLADNPVFFDERFGVGGPIPTGSESVFLSDALRRGQRLLYYPAPIVRHPDASSGRALYQNSAMLKAKGGMFYRIFRWKAYLLCLLFAYRKRRETGYDLNSSIQLMFLGIKEFKAAAHAK